MKPVIIFFSLIYVTVASNRVFSQSVHTVTVNSTKPGAKPSIDSLAIVKWPVLRGAVISNDGNYCLYNMDNRPVGTTTLVVQQTDGGWKKELLGISDARFTENSRILIYKSNDTVNALDLQSGQLRYSQQFKSFKQPDRNRDWIACQDKSAPATLELQNLVTGQKDTYSSVIDYTFDPYGKVLLLISRSGSADSITMNVQWVDLEKLQSKTIWSAASSHFKNMNTNAFVFDNMSNKLAFILQGADNGRSATSVWYYSTDNGKSIRIADNNSPGIDSGLQIETSQLKFSKNGTWIFFKLTEAESKKQNGDLASVDVWSYHDKVLQSEQLKNKEKKSYTAAINWQSKLIRRIEKTNERSREDFGDYIIINDNEFYAQETWWKQTFPRRYYLISLQDGARKFITKANFPKFYFSPDSTFFVFYDTEQRAYFRYDIATGNMANISKIAPVLFSYEPANKLDKNYYAAVGVIGWYEDNTGLLVYDNYDIWLLDASGKKQPLNITNGYGRKNKINLRLLREASDNTSAIFKKGDTLLLVGNNTINKKQGVFKSILGNIKAPDILTMEPYKIYQFTNNSLTRTVNPVRAKYNSSWIIQRMSYNSAPNFYYTTDFRKFKPLTDVQPQKEYNWFTAELITWRQFDGDSSQGILYKPEDFDPKKKYPVIFHYYEKMSDRLYDYPFPEFTSGHLNIPWFVSNGYLVFTPDIQYTIGKTGGSVYNSVISAANYISKLPYVDSKRLGLQGYSFGGFETNYLITHTNIFTAAVDVAGPSDLISSYGGLLGINGLGKSSQFLHEIGQLRMGANLWEKPAIFINNSPVFKADKVTTPLLMMHNKNDENVPWMQSVEFFTALRRLGKKVWMLQYDNEDHVLRNEKNIRDFTIRLTQFFDHYLKNKLPPKWMTYGIPANLKMVESGFELETKTNQD